MKIIKFKTNIDNEEGVVKVATFLDQVETVSNWQVDTQSDEKILSAAGENLDPQQVENAVEQAGYRIEVLRVLGASGEGL